MESFKLTSGTGVKLSTESVVKLMQVYLDFWAQEEKMLLLEQQRWKLSFDGLLVGGKHYTLIGLILLALISCTIFQDGVPIDGFARYNCLLIC